MLQEKRKLPDALEHEFVICDNTVNRKGWRLLVEGIDLTGFLKNPVCCVDHDIRMIPIGKWKNLHIQEHVLKGTLEFDRNDEDAIKLYWKYKDGFMSAVSLHVLPKEESVEPKMLLPGQKYATLILSEMLEISLVTVPGQKNAVKLTSPEGVEYKLNVITKEKTMYTEEKTTEIRKLEEQLAESKKLNIQNLIQMHKQRGVIEEGELASLEKLALADYQETSKMLDARTAVQEKKPTTKIEDESKKLAIVMQNFAGGLGEIAPQNERETWDYLNYYKKDPEALSLMQKEDPDRYKKLEADFLVASKKSGLAV